MSEKHSLNDCRFPDLALFCCDKKMVTAGRVVEPYAERVSPLAVDLICRVCLRVIHVKPAGLKIGRLSA